MRTTSNTDQLSWRPRVLYDGKIVDGARLHADHVATLDRRHWSWTAARRRGLSGGAQALTYALPNGTHRRLEHGPSPDVIAQVLIAFVEV